MPLLRQNHMQDVVQQEKLQDGKRKAALYRITDPLWKAIELGHKQEVFKLMEQLRVLVEKDKIDGN